MQVCVPMSVCVCVSTELEVVDKIDIEAQTAEDVQAVQLLNAVACIRQLYLE